MPLVFATTASQDHVPAVRVILESERLTLPHSSIPKPTPGADVFTELLG